MYAASICRRFEGLYLNLIFVLLVCLPLAMVLLFTKMVKVSLRDKPITREQAEDLLMYHLNNTFKRGFVVVLHWTQKANSLNL